MLNATLQSSTARNVVRFMMHFAVKHLYQINRYTEQYRFKRQVTLFERLAIKRFLQKTDGRNPRILDLGCGGGYPYDDYFIKQGCSVTGVDYCSRHIASARKNVSDAEYVCADMLTIELENNHYDGAVMLYSLFHVHREMHEELLTKIHDCLTEKGVILLNVREEDSGYIKFRHNFCGKPMLWSHYDYKTFRNIASDAGYAVTRIGDEQLWGSSEKHLWILLEKKC